MFFYNFIHLVRRVRPDYAIWPPSIEWNGKKGVGVDNQKQMEESNMVRGLSTKA